MKFFLLTDQSNASKAFVMDCILSIYWFCRFKSDFNINDKSWCKNVDLQVLLNENLTLSISELARELNVDRTTVIKRLHIHCVTIYCLNKCFWEKSSKLNHIPNIKLSLNSSQKRHHVQSFLKRWFERLLKNAS